MAEKQPDDGRIGKEIDWSLVIPSITRPTWEPGALEVLDGFENDDRFGYNTDNWKAQIPDIEKRVQMEDLYFEMAPLARYLKWANETFEAAVALGDQQRVTFYSGLLEALVVEAKQITRETSMLYKAIEKWEKDNGVDEENSKRDVDAISLDSYTSYHIAKDDVSAQSNDSKYELGNLIDISSGARETDSLGDLNTILQSSGIAQMSKVDRLS